MLKRLNRPWLHFLVLGTGLYLLMQWLYPPPKPVVGPLAESRMEALKTQWFSTTGRPPSELQLQRMAQAELDREILFQEALSMKLHLYDSVVRQRLIKNMRFLRLGENKTDEELYQDALRMELHLGDEVVKRRLIQVMEQLLLASKQVGVPDDATVQARFQEQREELRRPPRISIEHLFFPRDREDDIAAVRARIEEQALTATEAREMSSPFLPGYRFVAQSPSQLARHFGAAFVSNLEQLEPQAQTWVGPVESTYGYHLVWIDALEPARDAELAEVEKELRRDLLLEQRNEALREAIAEVRERYEVLL
jgi:hypothetical protein